MFPGLAGAGSSLEATLPSLGRGDGRNQQLNLMKSYSQNIRRWLALATVVATPALTASAQKLFFENFDAVPLGPNPEEASKGDKVWTRTPPVGWLVDDSQMPGFGTPDTPPTTAAPSGRDGRLPM